jgi:hypothetical protein
MVNLLLTIGWRAFPKCNSVRFLRRLAATWQTAPNVGHAGPFGLIRESVLLNTYIGLLCPKGTRRLGHAVGEENLASRVYRLPVSHFGR